VRPWRLQTYALLDEGVHGAAHLDPLQIYLDYKFAVRAGYVVNQACIYCGGLLRGRFAAADTL